MVTQKKFLIKMFIIVFILSFFSVIAYVLTYDQNTYIVINNETHTLVEKRIELETNVKSSDYHFYFWIDGDSITKLEVNYDDYDRYNIGDNISICIHEYRNKDTNDVVKYTYELTY